MKIKPETQQAAYSIPALNLDQTVAARKGAFRELDHALIAVKRARQGFDDLRAKASELEHRADAIGREIATAGGAEAAARALGIAGAALGVNADSPATDPVDVKAMAAELDAVRAELRETTAAIAAAPELFPQLIEALDAARHRAVDTHQRVREEADAWARQARETVAKIMADEKFVTDFLVSHHPAGVALPGDFVSLDQNELQRIMTERGMIEAARSEAKPLVAENKPMFVDSNPDWAARMSAKNAESERQWRAERAAREAQEAEQARAVAEAKREAQRKVAAARAASVS